jgi:hypothetical protein
MLLSLGQKRNPFSVSEFVESFFKEPAPFFSPRRRAAEQHLGEQSEKLQPRSSAASSPACAPSRIFSSAIRWAWR